MRSPFEPSFVLGLKTILPAIGCGKPSKIVKAVNPFSRSFPPRSGLTSTRGAGAPLLLPELARSSGREGGKGTKGRPIPANFVPKALLDCIPSMLLWW
ncbi:hypothetical protein DA102_029135 [Sinorhizobium meliloti]|nr:hypothetical protein DA102_029135 [Sinorhizobium meliloti]